MSWNNFLNLIRHQLVIDLCLITIATSFFAVISRKLLKFASRPPAPPWLISLLDSVDKAAPFLIFLYGAIYAIEATFKFIPHILDPRLFALARYIFLAWSLCWLVLSWKNIFIEGLSRRLRASPEPLLDTAALYALSKLVSILIVSVAALIILDLTGVPVSTLLAFGGVGGLAISWAAKDVIANFFGGLMIYVNRPFSTGDWIKSPNKHFEGVVEDIGWYRTRIRTFERRPIYIPNSMITDASIENPGRMYNRRLKADIGLRYQDIEKAEKIILEIRQMLKSHPEVDRDQLLLVHLVEYTASSVNINIYAFTRTTKWEKYRDIQQDVLLKVANIIKKNGAGFAFPSRSLYMHPATTSPVQAS